MECKKVSRTCPVTGGDTFESVKNISVSGTSYVNMTQRLFGAG